MAQTTRAKNTRLACNSCRRQRRKCDRSTPACSSCEKRNEVCVYDPTFDQRSPEQKDYVAALEARVVLLEGILRDASAKDVATRSGLASTDEGDTSQAMRAAIAPPPIASTQPGPSLEPERALGSETEFVPSDDAAQALVPIIHQNLGEVAVTIPDEFDLGMSGYVPLVSLDMERKLIAQFWGWQTGHLPYVAPVPFLSAYALYAQVAHPDEPTPAPSLPPSNPLACPSATDIPSVESVYATPELAQFISPLLLDAMFVIGALFHGNAEMSAQFCKRAESRVMGETANPRLATVQGVMLMAIAEFGHARAPAAWALNGIVAALCVRLRMHIDATPHVRDGNMSKMLFETRNFVFWTTYHNDRFYAACLGMHPLLDRRSISTPRHSSLAAVNVVKPVHPEPDASVAGLTRAPAERSTMPDVSAIWQSPMGDMFVQAGWEAMHDLARITDMLFNEIYALDAPKRTPQEDLELVARNNLTIQRFLDNLPTHLRSTDTTRRKSTALVYLHLAIHTSIILMCRPFLSPRPLSEDAMRLDATTDVSQPTHSSHIIRRYRTLAFRIARASALQIISLVRHIPLSSPCVKTPYLVHTACTILLLAPGDTVSMGGVRMGVTSLKSIQETGHWNNSMEDARVGVLALANRWSVDIERGKKLLGLALRSHRGSRGGGGGGKEPVVGEANGDASASDLDARPIGADSSDIGSVQRFSGGSNGASSNSVAENGNESPSVIPLRTSTMAHDEKAETGDHRNPDSTQECEEDRLTQMYANPEYSEGVVSVSNYGYAEPLSQGDYGTVVSGARRGAVARIYDIQEHSGNQYSHASRLVYADEPTDGPTYAPQKRSYSSTLPVQFETQIYGARNNCSSHTYSGIVGPELQVQHGERLISAPWQQIYHQPQRQQKPRYSMSEQRQQTQYQPHIQHQSQRSRIYTHQRYPQHYHEPTRSAPLPHVACALPHAKPQHHSQLPHTHWHQVLPPASPNLPLPPDPATCSDLAVYFADTIQTMQDPVFVKSMEDPYAGMAVDWVSDAECNYPVTLDAFTSTGGTGSSTGMGPMGTGVIAGMSTNGGAPRIYAQSNEAKQSYRHGHPAYGHDGAGHMGGYGGQGM
ncbi:hypothetical protein BDV93DRAFT_250737 [Ceratobasidium sp. AG-I]|nr:hypothetical protein BDV93DRAFT_250737 [Ceratobasidium sp. AG-I]